MQIYSAYWIKENVARRYFYKSDLLYRFLRSFHKQQDRDDYVKQFKYITNYFSSPQIISDLKRYHQNNVSIEIYNHRVEISNHLHDMTLHIDEKHIEFLCQTIHDAEELLFPVLRLHSPFLFITGINLDSFGWISPAALDKTHYREQALYSLL